MSLQLSGCHVSRYCQIFQEYQKNRCLEIYKFDFEILLRKMVLLENDAFLLELTKLFQKARLEGSVMMTFKRYNGRNKPIPRQGRPPLPEPQEHMCLVRAKSKSKKLATVIHQKDINKFQVAYSNLLKGNLDGLKKLKKPKAKTKAE